MKRPRIFYCEDLRRFYPLMDRLMRRSAKEGREYGFLAYKDWRGRPKLLETCRGDSCTLPTKSIDVIAGGMLWHTHPVFDHVRPSIGDWYYAIRNRHSLLCVNVPHRVVTRCWKVPRATGRGIWHGGASPAKVWFESVAAWDLAAEVYDTEEDLCLCTFHHTLKRILRKSCGRLPWETLR